MEIRIDPETVIKADFDVIGFKKLFNQTTDIKKAIVDNIKINFTAATISEIKIKDMLYYGTDWENVLYFHDINKEKVMRLKVYKCEVDGFKIYCPDSIQPKGPVIKLKNVETKDAIYFLVTNSFNLRIDKHIEYMLGQNCIDYVNYDWKFEFDLN